LLGNDGKDVRKKLEGGGIYVVATSRDGRDGTIPFDVTKNYSKVENMVLDMVKTNRCSSVVSCIGAIGSGKDLLVNGAAGQAALGAMRQKTIRNFVAIGPSPALREKVPVGLEDYVRANELSEGIIAAKFGSNGLSYTIVNPGEIEKVPKKYSAGAPIPLDTVVNALVVGATGFYIGEESAILNNLEDIKQKAAKFEKVQQKLFKA